MHRERCEAAVAGGGGVRLGRACPGPNRSDRVGSFLASPLNLGVAELGLRGIALLGVLGALIPLAFIRPWTGVLSWTWVGLMNPHRMTWTLEQIPIAMLIGAATLAGLFFTTDRRAPPWTREMVLLAILVVYSLMTTVFAWHPEVAWPGWDRFAKIVLFTFVTTMLIWGRQRIRYLLLVIVGSLGFYGVKGGIFSIATGGQYRIYGPERSFIGDNTSIGLALCMLLPLALLSARQEHVRWIRWALYAIFWLSIPAIVFTYSRGALLGLAAVAPFLAWRYKRRGIMLLAAAAIAAGGVYQLAPEKWFERQTTIATYEQSHSAMQRIQAWGVAFNVAVDRPLRGAGFNFEEGGNTARWLSYANFVEPWARTARAAHSIYFQVMGELGLVAFLLYMMLLGGTFLRLHRLGKLERDPHYEWIGTYARAAQIAMVPYLVAGAFLSLAYFDLFYTLVGLSAILEWEYRAMRRRAEEPEAPRGASLSRVSTTG